MEKRAVIKFYAKIDKSASEAFQLMKEVYDERKSTLLKKKINSVEERVGTVEKEVEEEIAIVEKKIERIKELVEERIKEQVEEGIERVAENFSLMSQRLEDLEKKLLDSGNVMNENKIVSAAPVDVPSSVGPLTASAVSVKLSTYDITIYMLT
ncbi:hypothetical protein TNCV_4297751 [Trichonephila clavipes]|nr:hypothetical protein TNCV_4297751 [Trichonephila clavipes]